MKIISFTRLQNSSKKNLFVIPFFFTFANALCGFLSVIKTLDENFLVASLFIVLAACMDFCDGRLARMFGSTSVLGMELDSLCDAISFCFAPAILLYSWSLYQLGFAGMMVLGIYLCCGLFRLARFNTSSSSLLLYFIGLPTTIAAFFFANVVIGHEWLSGSVFKTLLKADRLAFIVTIVALLMISSIKFPSSKHIKLPKGAISIIAILLAPFLVFLLLNGYPLFLIAVTLYIILSFLISIFREIMHV